ncbi:MAG: hypothetical protein JWO91_2102 [Acidobacteriaceae bacterium]|jgi:hypothetical protein|nr:hypothetical protein [Acidobacteriaceae bacterium]
MAVFQAYYSVHRREHFDVQIMIAASLAGPSFEELTVKFPSLHVPSVVIHLAEIVTNIPQRLAREDLGDMDPRFMRGERVPVVPLCATPPCTSMITIAGCPENGRRHR